MKGGVNFAPALKNPSDPAHSRRWKLGLATVNAHDMPPDDADKQPTDPEREEFMAWVGRLKYLSPRDPGAFVIRRLTKTEYGNTLHDLLGVSPDIVKELPDEVPGEGYLNTLSPLQMEQYLGIANAALELGMTVYGFDPAMTVQNAWQLNSGVKQALSVDDLVSKSQFISVHVPLLDATRGLINAERIALMQKPGVLLNFARAEIMDEEAVIAGLKSGALQAYACDFPSNKLTGNPKVIATPHLGASTGEAEDNCAIMVADQLRDAMCVAGLPRDGRVPAGPGQQLWRRRSPAVPRHVARRRQPVRRAAAATARPELCESRKTRRRRKAGLLVH